MDKKDKADRPQSMQAGSGVKRSMWSFQCTVWFATFPALFAKEEDRRVQRLAPHTQSKIADYIKYVLLW